MIALFMFFSAAVLKMMPSDQEFMSFMDTCVMNKIIRALSLSWFYAALARYCQEISHSSMMSFNVELCLSMISFVIHLMSKHHRWAHTVKNENGERMILSGQW